MLSIKKVSCEHSDDDDVCYYSGDPNEPCLSVHTLVYTPLTLHLD